MKASTLIIVTGDRGAGKTIFCARLIELARSSGRSIGGVLSPAVFEEGEKIGIDAIDLRTRERRRLADRFDPAQQGPSTRRWSFHADTIKWGNTVLQSVTSCDVLIVDELGTLEFDRGEGWIVGLNAIDAGDYRLGVVVIRPELLNAAQQRWPQAQVIEIIDVEQARSQAELCLRR
jgi:nucleoside-triphosphatase